MPVMTAVAQEMLDLAEKIKFQIENYSDARINIDEAQLAIIALRESALSRNEVVNARLI